MIELTNVSYAYHHEHHTMTMVLSDVSLSFREGQFVCVLGHNGSGKSTLAKHLNALLLPEGGSVSVWGMDSRLEKHLWDIRQRVGMVFQNPDNQMVATVVEEDVAFGLENIGIPPLEIRKRVDFALARVGMLDYRTHAPHLLSGGQKQRVAIAGVLAMKPKCIVLDEPTAMLDPIGRREVMEALHTLNQEDGVTVIHITHFMEEAVKADRVVVMEGGKVLLDNTPTKVFSHVELLKKTGLDVPQVTELAYALKKHGIDLGDDLLTIEQALDKIERLLKD